MSNELVNVSNADFSAAAYQDGSRINARLKGNADVSALDAIARLLVQVHAEATRLGIEETIVDLRELEFMNSSCFKGFVTWISNIQTLDSDRQYKVKFLSNPAMHWQKRSLHALRCFAVELITVEACGVRG